MFVPFHSDRLLCRGTRDEMFEELKAYGGTIFKGPIKCDILSEEAALNQKRELLLDVVLLCLSAAEAVILNSIMLMFNNKRALSNITAIDP